MSSNDRSKPRKKSKGQPPLSTAEFNALVETLKRLNTDGVIDVKHLAALEKIDLKNIDVSSPEHSALVAIAKQFSEDGGYNLIEKSTATSSIGQSVLDEIAKRFSEDGGYNFSQKPRK